MTTGRPHPWLPEAHELGPAGPVLRSRRPLAARAATAAAAPALALSWVLPARRRAR